MVFFSGFVTLGVSLVAAVARAAPATPEQSSDFQAGLNVAAQVAKKLYFGTATNADQWNDTTYFDILKDDREFGQITAANVMKWFDTEPEPGVFNFTDGDVIANFVKATGKRLRGHNCVWHNQLPDWLSNGTFSAPELAHIVERHCFTLVSHYRGQVYSWDVINEPFNDDGTFREDIFFDTLNTSYIPLALKAARRADPHTKLYINDFNIEGTGAKATALKELIKSLKASGVPIDGVGIQSHLTVGGVPATLQQNMAEFTALGVEVAISKIFGYCVGLISFASTSASRRSRRPRRASRSRRRTTRPSSRRATPCPGVWASRSGISRISIRGFRARSLVRVRLALGTRTL